jgi:hypothetical protein
MLAPDSRLCPERFGLVVLLHCGRMWTTVD